MGNLRTNLSQAYEKEHSLDLRNLLFQINLLHSLKLLHVVDRNIRRENCPKGKKPCFDDLKEPCAEDVIHDPLLKDTEYAINKGNIECHRLAIAAILEKRDAKLQVINDNTAAEVAA